jgi:hypothetical protein
MSISMVNQNDHLFTWRPVPTTWLSFLLTILLFPLGLLLPSWWGWENGPIEDIQLSFLSAGLVLSWLSARYHRHDRPSRNFFLWLMPCWLLAIGRELSWGRVFYPVTLAGEQGPRFLPLHGLWYGKFVYPVNTVIIIATLAGLCHSFSRSEWKQTLRIPAIDTILFILAATAAELIFEKNIFPALKPYAQLLEEGAETIAYWCLVSITAAVGFDQRPASRLGQVPLPVIHRYRPPSR